MLFSFAYKGRCFMAESALNVVSVELRSGRRFLIRLLFLLLALLEA